MNSAYFSLFPRIKYEPNIDRSKRHQSKFILDQ